MNCTNADKVDTSKCYIDATFVNGRIGENPAAALQLMQLSMQERMAIHAQKYYQDNLSLKVGSRRFAQLFNRLAAK